MSIFRRIPWTAVRESLLPRRCAIGGEWGDESSVSGVCRACHALAPRLPAVPLHEREPGPVREVVAALSYEDPIPRLVYSMKYGADRGAALSLAAFLAESVEETGLQRRIDVLVPVPSFWAKRLMRGAEPTRWIAEELGRRWCLPVRRVLRRRRATAALGQFEPDRARRERALAGAFAARPASRAWRARVGLVDDLWTTGATASAAAGALRGAGTGPVTVLVAALAGGARLGRAPAEGAAAGRLSPSRPSGSRPSAGGGRARTA